MTASVVKSADIIFYIRRYTEAAMQHYNDVLLHKDSAVAEHQQQQQPPK